MLIALFTVMILNLFGGGAGFDDIKEGIKDAVEKGERRDDALAIVEAGAGEVSEYHDDLAIRIDALKELAKRHDADRLEVEQIVAAIDAQLQASESRVVDMSFELREALTEDEWTRAFADEGSD